MMAPRERHHRGRCWRDRSVRHGDAGSTLPELLVAISLLLVALGMIGGNALPSLRALEATTAVDGDAQMLELAADAVVRAVRAARSVTGDDGAVAGAADGDAARVLIVDLASGDEQRRLRIAIEDGVLHVSPLGDADPPLGYPIGTIVEGLDDTRSSLRLMAAAPSDASDVVAVVVELVSDSHQVRRVVRLRSVR